MSGFSPWDPVGDGGVGKFQVISPDDGNTYAAEGPNWVNTLTQSANSLYVWDDDITATDPGTSKVKFNNADEGLATEIYISASNFIGQDFDSILNQIAKGDFVVFKRFGAQSNFVIAKIIGDATDNTGWFTIPIAVQDNGGGFSAGDTLEFVYVPSSARASGITVQGLLEGTSVATTQDPTGLGFANAIQIEFGPAQLTGSDPVQLLADGTLRFNKVGTYRIKISLQFGRSSAAGVSELFFRVTDGAGNQLGRSIASLIDNANTDRYIENDAWVNIPSAPLEFKYEVMRDSSGNNSGGLINITPTDEGAGTWNGAPTAVIRVERWA